MPFLAVVHLRALQCPECGAPLAEAGARSFVVDGEGEPVAFDDERVPEAMTLQLTCPNGHATTLLVPNEVGAEDVAGTPDGAPIAADAVLIDF